MQSLCRDVLYDAELKAAINCELLFYHFYAWIVSGFNSIVVKFFIGIYL